MRSRALVPVVAAAVVVACAAGAAAQVRRRPPLVIDSMVGSDLYRFYCASCHGRDGKGAGPLAEQLRTRPADLTAIAQRHGGVFSRSQVAAYVSSEDPGVVAHGPRAMPVWGPIFRGLDPSEVRTKMRIESLVLYIESMQTR